MTPPLRQGASHVCGYVERQPVEGLGVRVAITEGGERFLREHGRATA